MNGCSACVYNHDSHEYFVENEPMLRGHAEQLVPMVGRVMARAGLEYEALDAVVVTVGPGAYTGLRIGLSAARSFGMALDIPVYGMTTLQVLALEYLQKREIENGLAVLVETKREDFYVQMFDTQGQPMGEAQAITVEEIEAQMKGRSLVFIGDAVPRFKALCTRKESGWVFKDGFDLPDPLVMAQALVQGGASSPFLIADAQPVYLRPPNVSQSKKQQRVIDQ